MLSRPVLPMALPPMIRVAGLGVSPGGGDTVALLSLVVAGSIVGAGLCGSVDDEVAAGVVVGVSTVSEGVGSATLDSALVGLGVADPVGNGVLSGSGPTGRSIAGSSVIFK